MNFDGKRTKEDIDLLMCRWFVFHSSRSFLMTSFIDSLAASEKTAVVIDIGHAYSK